MEKVYIVIERLEDSNLEGVIHKVFIDKVEAIKYVEKWDGLYDKGLRKYRYSLEEREIEYVKI